MKLWEQGEGVILARTLFLGYDGIKKRLLFQNSTLYYIHRHF